MGRVLDTVLADVHNAATSAIGLTAATAATGDSFAVRAFTPQSWARLEAMFLHAAAGPRTMSVRSPRFHDNVTGITINPAELPTEFGLPPQIGQPVYQADTLTVLMDAAASSDTVAALLIYYNDLTNSNADLRSWADIAPNVISIKAFQTSVVANATIGQWSDTVITTTDNQFHADRAYAVLGFETSAALLCMGLKGPATGNYRVCAPGATPTVDLSSYFVLMSDKHQTPHIPVFKANDRASTFVSVAAPTASQAASVGMICAELPQ